MTFLDLRQIFNRALSRAFSRKKFMLLFPVLVVCGLSIVFCRVLAFGASKWVGLSLMFLPVFLSSGILLGVGVLLARIYYREHKGMEPAYIKVLKQSAQLLVGVSYLSLPLLLAYLILWTCLGVFYLLKEIPGVGDVISVVLAFAPFLLVLGSLLLCISSLFILFFATPYIALKDGVLLTLGEEMFARFRSDPFTNICLFVVGITPLVVITTVLILAAFMTGLHFSPTPQLLTIALQWFFIMLPFCALLTPGITFFFNFATEAFGLTRRLATQAQ